MELQNYLVSKGYIPLDKSWIIRMGILDLINGCPNINYFLESQQNLGRDLEALRKIVKVWNTSEPFDAGESGTIYRFLKFYLWKNNINRKIIIRGTLTERSKNMCQNPDIINWHPEELLKLDNQTSQWATMAYLFGDRRRVKNPPYKLKVTYDAVEHWEQQRKKGETWIPRADPTILNQALAFIDYVRNAVRIMPIRASSISDHPKNPTNKQGGFSDLRTEKIKFSPEQAEDYCFARAFDVMTQEQGRKLYPSLEGHETPRFEEIEKSLIEAKSGKIISSEDHRVVQAIAMKYFPDGFGRSNFVKSGCVNKTWPKFWDFLADAENIKKR